MTSTAPTWGTASSAHRWLQPGETVLWEGRPDPKVVFSKQDAYLIPFSVLWCGFVVFWELGVFSSGWGFGTVWGIPFLLVGLYLTIGRFFYKRFDRRRTQYFITEHRAVVVQSNGQRVKDAPVASAPMEVVRSRDGRHGSIIWTLVAAQRPPELAWGPSAMANPALLRGSGWPVSTRNGRADLAFLDVSDFERLVTVVSRVRAVAAPLSLDFPPPSVSERADNTVTPTAFPTGTREWGRWPIPVVSTLFLVVGLAVAVGTAIFAVNRLSPYLYHPPTMSVPGSTHLALERGTYVLFGHPVGHRSCSGAQCITFGPADVTVTSSSDSHLRVVTDNTSDRFTQNDLTYPAVAEFYVSHPGRYTVQVYSPTRANVVIEVSPGQELHAFGGWIALGVAGALLFIGAVVSLVGALATRPRLLYPSSLPPGRTQWLTNAPPPWRMAFALVFALVIVLIIYPVVGPWIAIAVAGVIFSLGLIRGARRRGRQGR